jgi:hypothetical protein
MSMNRINPIADNPINAANEHLAPQERPTVQAVRDLATYIRAQTTPMIHLVNNPFTAQTVLPQAQAMAKYSVQMLKNLFVEPHEGHADFLQKLQNCTDEVRHNARHVARFAISLNNNSFEALEVASQLLERGPSHLLITTPLGPWSLSKHAIDSSLLYQTTGDIGVLLDAQPDDSVNLAALHAEWAQEDSVAPYALPR